MKKTLIVCLVIFLLPAIPAFFMQSKISEYVYKGHITQDIYGRTVEDLKNVENILWLDSRKKSKFEAAHIQGALNVSFKDWEACLLQIFENFEPGQDIVVYCNPSCSTSRNIAKKLRKELGQENAYFLIGGFEAWQKRSK